MTKPIPSPAFGQPAFAASAGQGILDPASGASPFFLPPVEPDEIGRLGPYRVLRLLGQGGMGSVFEAEDIALGRRVALKVMNPDVARDANGCARFLREARIMASVKHDSLATVFQVGQEQGVVFLAMELLEGVSLEDWLERVPTTGVPVILDMARSVASGLEAIHRHGLVHRDVKPANLWVLEPGDRVKILDFGLARFLHDEVTLTRPGMVVGTPCYMSPEQARGEAVDPRSDLFSFGCVLYRLCTGTNPFQARHTAAVLTALAMHDPVPVHKINPAIPRGLSDLVAQLLAKDREDRPASAEEVLQRLQQIEGPCPSAPATRRLESPTSAAKRRRSRPTRARKRRAALPRRFLWALTVLLAAGMGLGAVYLLGSRARPTGAAPTGEAGSAEAKAPAAKVFLSDLQPSESEFWPFLPPTPPGRSPFQAIGGFRIQGKDSPHGIFMHPPPGWEGAASITYRLPGGAQTFRAAVSLIDGPAQSESPLTFAVHGDGRLLWQSRPVQAQADGQTCTVPVRGVDRLRLEVRCSGDSRGAHAAWFEPILEP